MTLNVPWPLVLLVVVPGVCIPAQSDIAGNGNPVAVIELLHAALVEGAIRRQSLSFDLQVLELEPVIASSHDFVTIGRLVGGRFWSKLGENERSSFVDAFRRVSVAAYASRFTAMAGVNFSVAMLYKKTRNRAWVTSDLMRVHGSNITFAYTLGQTRDGWRIIAIIVDGVSDMALRRAELSRAFNESGFAGVMENLEKKRAEAATDVQ